MLFELFFNTLGDCDPLHLIYLFLHFKSNKRKGQITLISRNVTHSLTSTSIVTPLPFPGMLL